MPISQVKISKSITTRDSESFNIYLKEISKIKRISVEEEIELGKRIKEGDDKAVEKLVNANLRFVVSVAKQFSSRLKNNKGLSIADLVNEGNVGLYIAAKRFDHTKGYKFISYAVWWIRQHIISCINNSEFIYRPNNKTLLYSKILEQQRLFLNENDREATPEELSEILNVSKENIISALNHIYPCSLSVEIFENGTLEDVLSDDSITDHEISEKYDNKLLISVLKNYLGERNSNMLVLHFGLSGYNPLKYSEIAKIYNLSSNRVKQLIENSLRRLKFHKVNKILKLFY